MALSHVQSLLANVRVTRLVRFLCKWCIIQARQPRCYFFPLGTKALGLGLEARGRAGRIFGEIDEALLECLNGIMPLKQDFLRTF